jgi:hypothetical protein
VKLTWGVFRGANLADDPRLLSDSVCTNVLDADPTRIGTLLPFKTRSTVATVPSVPQRLGLWRMGRDVPNDSNYWLSWTSYVDAMLAFGSNTTERTFFTGSGSPKWTDNVIGLSGGAPYPQGTRELAVPNPSQAPTAALNVDGSTGTAALRFYVETFVNDLGWESGPSAPSVGVTCKPGATLNLTLNASPPAGNYGFTLRRIYRTQPDVAGASEFYFLREVAIGTTSTTDDARALGELLPTENFLPPPSTAHSICPLWNSMVALLDGRTLLVCEPGFPYAYPLANQKNLQSTGVALKTWGENLLVLTTGAPVHFYGVDPESMTDRPPGRVMPCRNKPSAVALGHGVAWASNEGLAYYGDKGIYIATEGLIKPDQWKAMNPQSMVAGRWNRFYVCCFNDGTRRAFMMDPARPDDGLWFLSLGFDACHYDELADQLYLLEGDTIKKFNAGPGSYSLLASSKKFLQPRPTNFAYAKVEARAYPVTLKVYVDGALQETRSVPNGDAFTLEGKTMGREWQLEVSGSNEVELVRLAHRLDELATA